MTKNTRRGAGGKQKPKRARPRPAAVAKDRRPAAELRVAITFRRPQGDFGPRSFGATLDAAAVRSLAPDSRAVGRALSGLEQRGFRVTARGPLTASVRCPRETFERVFGTRLAPVVLSALAGGRLAVDSVLYPPADAPWNPEPAVAELIDDACIQWPHVEFDRRFDPPPPFPIPPRVAAWHFRVPTDVALALDAARVHRQGITGRGVRVAMVDSGFAHGHAWFQEMGYRSSVILAAGATEIGLDGSGHGTGESANLLSIAPDVEFIGIKLDSEEDPLASASLLEGFQEALAHQPRVISVSLGYDLVVQGDPQRRHLPQLPNGLLALQAEIQAAVDRGIVVVFSAGNGHVAFPAMMPAVIAAGGAHIDELGGLVASDYASAFTSRVYPGRRVPDVSGLVGPAATGAQTILLPVPPGSEIDAAMAQSDGTTPGDGWGLFSGTSAAAPQIAGVCALLLQQNPGLTPAEVKSLLARSCRDVIEGQANPASNEFVPVPASPGADGATGAGFVDAFAAWRLA